MKHLSLLLNLIIIFFFTFLSTGKIFAQQAAQEKDNYKIVSDKVANRDFVFKASSLTPMGGRLRILTPEYDVKVNKDIIISYLPYFGRAETAPVNTEDAGVMFTSKNFEYNSGKGKKKSWNVDINFKDQHSTKEFNFIIYDDGTAVLNVTSNFRDPISYRGSIKLE